MSSSELPPAWVDSTESETKPSLCVVCEDATTTVDSPFCIDCRDAEFLTYG